MAEQLQKRFFKKIVKEAEAIVVPVRKLHFPRISLSIPEVADLLRIRATLINAGVLNVSSRVFLFNFTVGFMLMALAIVFTDAQHNQEQLLVLQHERQAVEKQISYWKEIVGKYKGYRDGLYQLAVLEYRLGNKQLAREYAEKVLAIDPEFEKAQSLIKEKNY